jgi:hypothetical protein
MLPCGLALWVWAVALFWQAWRPTFWWFALAHGLLMGLLGSSSTFAPLLADTSLWWDKRRGIAVAVCASGNYLAGSIWPALAQQGVELLGWRETYIWDWHCVWLRHAGLVVLDAAASANDGGGCAWQCAVHGF